MSPPSAPRPPRAPARKRRRGALEDASRRFGVKQFVAIVRNRRGTRFAVFTCGDDAYYLFQVMVSKTPGDTVMGDLIFPVLRKDLRRDLRSALAHGVGNSPEPLYQFLPPGMTYQLREGTP